MFLFIKIQGNNLRKNNQLKKIPTKKNPITDTIYIIYR